MTNIPSKEPRNKNDAENNCGVKKTHNIYK